MSTTTAPRRAKFKQISAAELHNRVAQIQRWYRTVTGETFQTGGPRGWGEQPPRHRFPFVRHARRSRS